MISLKNVTREYPLDEQTVITPVNDVSLTVNKGDFLLIIGRSGSGKTTLLNLAAGLLRPNQGQVLIDGVDPWKLSDGEQSRLRSRKMGYIFQFPSLIPSLSALENVVLPAGFAQVHENGYRQQRAEELLKMLGLEERMGAYPRQLSAGEQRRVVIARALMNEPEVLLADEPTSDLDVQTEREIMDVLKRIHASGVTIVMVTHSLDLVPYATRTVRMANGAIADATTVANGEANARPAFVCAACLKDIGPDSEYRKVSEDGTEKVLCTRCHSTKIAAARREARGNSKVMPVLFGLGGAAIAGTVWYSFVTITEWQLGLVSIAMGWLVGKSVVWGAGKRRGRSLQWLAVGLTVPAIVVSEYFIFNSFIKEAIVAQRGIELGRNLSVSEFLRYYGSFFTDLKTRGFLDVLVFGFALWQAWRTPRALKELPKPK